MIKLATSASTDEPPSLQFTSGGFELYVPPTPFSSPPEPAHFVMLDDKNDTFYDVDYESLDLKNSTPWVELALYTVQDAAIVFPPGQWDIHEANKSVRVTGFLVSILNRTGGLFTAKKIGTVHVQPFPQKFMNWDALESLKGSELPSEMKAGLLRHVFNRRPGSGFRVIEHVTSRSILESMSRPWHRNGDALNWELDHRFAGGSCIEREQKWKLCA
jgi:hypothetical protein